MPEAVLPESNKWKTTKTHRFATSKRFYPNPTNGKPQKHTGCGDTASSTRGASSKWIFSIKILAYYLPIRCKQCGKMFQKPSLLKAHTRWPGKTRKHSIQICSESTQGCENTIPPKVKFFVPGTPLQMFCPFYFALFFSQGQHPGCGFYFAFLLFLQSVFTRESFHPKGPLGMLRKT